MADKRATVHFYVFADSDVSEGDEADQKLLDDKLMAAFLNVRRHYQSDQLTVKLRDRLPLESVRIQKRISPTRANTRVMPVRRPSH